MTKYFGVIGYSGSGKTRLIAKLVKYFSSKGLKIGTFKHTHHDFDFDKRGKDSYEHFKAGSHITLVSSPNRTGIFKRGKQSIKKSDLNKIYKGCDLVIIEGLRSFSFPCLEVYRKLISKHLLSKIENLSVKAVVTDGRIETPVPTLFKTGQVSKIAHFILNHAR